MRNYSCSRIESIDTQKFLLTFNLRIAGQWLINALIVSGNVIFAFVCPVFTMTLIKRKEYSQNKSKGTIKNIKLYHAAFKELPKGS